MNNFKNSEKGISLLITFFVMGIILSIILGITIILLSEIKIMRNIGYSVVSFYVADTGLEKTLFYDRKKVPENGHRGICDICDSCTDCANCTKTGEPDNCSPTNCIDCVISYSTAIDEEHSKIFNAITSISPARDTFQSFGIYKGVSRAIEISTGSSVSSGPIISNAVVVPQSVPAGIELDITADISDEDGLNPETLRACIQYPDEINIECVLLELSGGQTYIGQWTGPEGVYYVDILACDMLGACSEKENI